MSAQRAKDLQPGGPAQTGSFDSARRRHRRAKMPYGGTGTPEDPMREHDEEIGDRLGRIEGQIHGVRKMQADGRYCIDILDQLSAARAAIDAVALLVLEDHVNSCVRDAIYGGEGQAKTAEMLAAVQRFVRSV